MVVDMKSPYQKKIKINHQSIYFADLIDQVFLHLPTALLSNILLSLLIVVVLWSEISHKILIVWISVLWIITITRFVQYHKYRSKTDGSLKKWAYQFSFGVILTGIVWGSSGIFLFSRSSLPHQVFLAFVLGGLIAGAITSVAAIQWVFRVFVFIIIFPIIVQFFFIGGEIYFVMGGMLLIYAGMYTVMSSHIFKMLITSIRLRQENKDEIEERKKVEDKLIRYKDQLEEIVTKRTAILQEEITVRKQAEDKLRLSNERYHQITTNLPGLVFQLVSHTDGSYSIPYISEGVESMFGVTSEEVNQDINSIFQFLHPDDLLDFEHSLSKSAESLLPYNHELRILINGKVLWINIKSRPKRLENGDTLWDGIFFDITTLKLVENEKSVLESQLRRAHKIESIGILAGGIAHDFNNILAAILGKINLALFDEGLKKKTKNLLSEAEKASLRAKDLAQQLLTFSRGGEPIKKLSSLGNLIKDSANFVLQGGKVACSYDISEDLWLVEIDKGQMSQVIQNIVLNASQAMPEGGIIKITCENITSVSDEALPLDKNGKFIKICIRDSGVGIPANVVEKIFDPYFSTKQKGSGLGLAITQSIITRHNGYILLESSPGAGSSFFIYLPASEKTKTEKQKLFTVKKAHTQAKILIMDDDEMVRDVIKGMLVLLGHDFVLSGDGVEAVKLYQDATNANNNFDLVIMDLTIPGAMGGKEAVQGVLKINPNAKVIVSSGYSNDPIMANFKKYGFCSAIAKPYKLQELSKVISQLID